MLPENPPVWFVFNPLIFVLFFSHLLCLSEFNKNLHSLPKTDENEAIPSLSKLIPDSFQGDLDLSLRENKSHRKSAHLGAESSTSTSLVPGPPKDVRAAIVSKRFVTLSWSRPDEINGELVAYSVFYRLEGSQR